MIMNNQQGDIRQSFDVKLNLNFAFYSAISFKGRDKMSHSSHFV